jgi:hypothetical protein
MEILSIGSSTEHWFFEQVRNNIDNSKPNNNVCIENSYIIPRIVLAMSATHVVSALILNRLIHLDELKVMGTDSSSNNSSWTRFIFEFVCSSEV